MIMPEDNIPEVIIYTEIETNSINLDIEKGPVKITFVGAEGHVGKVLETGDNLKLTFTGRDMNNNNEDNDNE